MRLKSSMTLLMISLMYSCAVANDFNCTAVIAPSLISVADRAEFYQFCHEVRTMTNEVAQLHPVRIKGIYRTDRAGFDPHLILTAESGHPFFRQLPLEIKGENIFPNSELCVALENFFPAAIAIPRLFQDPTQIK